MDRGGHMIHIPKCRRNIGLPNQFAWKEKDTNKYSCTNGISHPIYDCKGWINFSLPLEMYPRVGEVHPQIEMTRRMHMSYRGNPKKIVPVHQRPTVEYYQHEFDDRQEGIYSRVPQRMVLSSDRVPGYKLPNPYGDNRGCSACGSCQ